MVLYEAWEWHLAQSMYFINVSYYCNNLYIVCPSSRMKAPCKINLPPPPGLFTDISRVHQNKNTVAQYKYASEKLDKRYSFQEFHF